MSWTKFVALLIIAIGVLGAQAPPPTFTTYSAGTIVASITSGPDGAIWFLEPVVNKIGRITAAGVITEYVTPSRPTSLSAGSDGALWFTEESSRRVGRITTSGAITEYDVPCRGSNCGGPTAIAASSDGALWFTECCTNGKIGRITTTGDVNEYFAGVVEAYDVTQGPDGAMWFLGWVNGGVTIKAGRITSSGLSTTYTIEQAQSFCSPGPLISGPDGNLWYGDRCGYGPPIGEITTAGVLSRSYLIPSGNVPADLTVGPDGAIWFPETVSPLSDEVATHMLGRVVPGGTVTEYNVPVNNVAAGASITAGADGALWFTDGFNTIIRAVPGGGPIATITTASLPVGISGMFYSANLTAQGGTGPYIWSIVSGSLPAGLSLNPSTGTISGTPAAGGSSFMVQVTDSSVPAQFATRALTIAISGTSSTLIVTTSPPGLAITVDGGPVATPYSAPCSAGSLHTVTILSPQYTVSPFALGNRYTFTDWSDGVASLTRQISCPSTTTTYTANFALQYLLTTTVTPAGAGTITVNPSSPDGYYNNGTSVQITASPSVVNWSGDLSGSTNPQFLVMNGPRSVIANFNTTHIGTASGLFPVTPCRLVDTRPSQGKIGPLGPPLLAPFSSRDFPLLSSGCGIPSSAQAYSLNVTAVPPGPLDFLSIWQAGQPYPGVSTLNSPDGSTVANAGIVPAGANGAVAVLSGNPTELIIDTNGYFGPSNGQELAFYPVTPCRVVDTRNGQGKSGGFGPPNLSAFVTRDFAIASSNCGIPASAQAYSLNMTAVPLGRLDFLSTWPAGQTYPGVSTLNSEDGSTIANAAIVFAGVNRAITVLAGNPTNLIIDINGYFAPPGAPGALHFYSVTPCRVADTRAGQGKTGAFGPPGLAAFVSRDFPIQASLCGIPATAQAYALNVTVVPHGHLDFLSAWPTGQAYPGVSTLNAPKGITIANMAIVAAGANGAITVLAGNPTDLIIDINGFFAP